MVTVERIRGRRVNVEVGEVPGIGWVAIGIVTVGLDQEKGMRFEVRADDPAEAQRRLTLEIEAVFA
jgi:hypothetical protein